MEEEEELKMMGRYHENIYIYLNLNLIFCWFLQIDL